MRSLLITAAYLPYSEYGAEKAVRMLANGLVEAGHDIRVVTTCPAGEERVARIDAHEVQYVAQKNFYWSGDRDTKSVAAKIAWHIRDTRNPAMGAVAGSIYDEWQPDVVHTHILAGFSVDVWLAAAARRIPIVHTLHDRYLFCPTSTMFSRGMACQSHCLGCRPFSLPRRWATAVVNGLTSPSQATLDVHTANHFFKHACCTAVVPNLVGDPPVVEPSSRAHGKVVGFIGRLSVEKGLRLLLQRFRLIPTGVVERLVIAGSGPLEAEVRAAALEDPRIVFNGYQNSNTFFADIDALVVPSICHDTSPNVIREAFAQGVPVVGSTYGGIPELLRLVDERLIFDTDDPTSLERSLAIALDPVLRQEFRKRSLATGDAFSAGRVIAGITDVYQAVVRNSTADCHQR